jgi:hypothetical protein
MEKEIKGGEADVLNAYCFALIGACLKTNADKMTINQKNVTKFGKNLGNWKITVEKI